MSRRVIQMKSDSRSQFDAKRAEQTSLHIAAQRITKEAKKMDFIKRERAPSSEGGAGGEEGNEQNGKREDERETKWNY